MATVEEKIKALAKELEIPEEEISETSWGTLETEDGREYFVGDYDESYAKAVELCKNVIDDLGFDSFTPTYKDYILNNFVDTDIFDDVMRESYEGYISDIESENSSNFDNRLIEELYDNGILEDSDFEQDEDGEPDYFNLLDSVDLEEKKEEYLDSLCDQDSVEWFKDAFGNEEFSEYITDRGTIDWDAVAEDCVDTDGIAHQIASYDGDELELDNDLYAYRVS